MIPWLDTHSPFPDVSEALTGDAPGLLAAGADLSPQRLLMAYRHGIFPWFSEGQPILWWSTDPRMVLMTQDFRISDSLKKTLRKVEREMAAGGRWQVRFDSAIKAAIDKAKVSDPTLANTLIVVTADHDTLQRAEVVLPGLVILHVGGGPPQLLGFEIVAHAPHVGDEAFTQPTNPGHLAFQLLLPDA